MIKKNIQITNTYKETSFQITSIEYRLLKYI